MPELLTVVDWFVVLALVLLLTAGVPAGCRGLSVVRTVGV